MDGTNPKTMGWGWGQEVKAFNGGFQMPKPFFFVMFQILRRTKDGRQSGGSKPTAMLIYSNCQFNYELLITKQVEYW